MGDISLTSDIQAYFGVFRLKMRAGFTLMEVMIVLALLAILSLVSVTAFLNMRESEELTAVEDRLVALIEEARSRTVSGENNQPYSVYVDLSEAYMFEGTNFSPSSTVVRSVNFGSQIISTSVTFPADTIRFNRLSGVAEEAGSISLRNQSDGATTTITVLKSGVVE